MYKEPAYDSMKITQVHSSGLTSDLYWEVRSLNLGWNTHYSE